MKKLLVLLSMFFLSISVSAQETNQNLLLANPEVKKSEYLIGNGDLIEIKVVGQTEMSGKYRVGESGKINLPYIGEIEAAGLSEKMLAAALQERLLKYLRSPEVSITVAEYNSKFVTIIGAVKTPGRYALQKSVRLFDIIGMAGGMSERAGMSVNLIRYSKERSKEDGEEKEVVEIRAIDLKELFDGRTELNYNIMAGDLINVPDADTIYVTGSVNKPGSYIPRAPITLTQAIALAGGMTLEASRKNISLYRVKPGQTDREELTFSLGDLEKRKVKDPILLPNDVVYIRGSESRSIGFAFIRALTGGLGNSVGFGVIR